MSMTVPLEAKTRTGERITVKPYITSSDVKILSHEKYTNDVSSGIKMSVEVSRIDPHSQPPQDIRAVTTGHIERTKTEIGYQVTLDYEIEFFRPANSTKPLATKHGTAKLDCEEAVTPSPPFPAFVWDRYKITMGSSQSIPLLGTMMRNRTVDISIERLIESHWEEGDDPISGFSTFINHVLCNSLNYDLMRADDTSEYE
jgi:hypothetical protein